MLSHARLRELLIYDEQTGSFIWRINRYKNKGALLAKAGTEAGSLDDGYRHITIDNLRYAAHVLAWFYVHGRWPRAEMDHVDRNRSNNAINNLREATISNNRWNRSKNRNNTSGYKGVCFDKKRNCWVALIGVHNKLVYLGSHDTPQQAHAAYCKAAAELHGEFARVS